MCLNPLDHVHECVGFLSDLYSKLIMSERWKELFLPHFNADVPSFCKTCITQETLGLRGI